MQTYNAPLRDMRFVLHELLDASQLAALPGFEDATPDVIDAVLDASEIYKAGNVPMGLAATGNPAIDLAQAFKDAHASNTMEHMKEATQSQEEERHAMVMPRHH